MELVERDSIRGFDRGNRSRAQGRLLVLIEAESLFNDGTAAVGFGLAISLVAGQDDWRGVLCGGAVAVGARLLVGTTDDHPVEISERGEAAIRDFWEYAAFVANSLVFLLIGMHEANRDFRAVWVVISLAIGLVHQHVLYWGGCGARSPWLSLSRGLPRDVPQRETIVTISFPVVAFSVFVQGLTIEPFLRRMGEIE